MRIQTHFRRVLLLSFVLLAVPVTLAPVDAGADKQTDVWVSLFNGKNLDGWDTWLGKPYKGNEVIGLNKDPNKVYTVVDEDGKPAIRISGEIFGALTSKQEFANYHLRLEFKWGKKKWPPRDGEKTPRDSGLLYHCVGKHGAAGTYWMRSLECQIQEHDCGDFWSVAGVMVDVEAQVMYRNPLSTIKYKKGATKLTVPRQLTGPNNQKRNDPRIIKSADYEKPGWNTIEVLSVGGTSVHLVNGQPNMVLTNSRHKVDGREMRLTKGKIQLQSEGAEVYYRNIAIKSLKEIPAQYLK
jgi:hypothetical protein